jgi:hypothetical protein
MPAKFLRRRAVKKMHCQTARVSKGSPRSSGRYARRLAFEPLEDRSLLAVLTVNSLADNTVANDGLVTLREAVLAANADGETDLGEIGSGADTIQIAANLGPSIELAVSDNSQPDNSVYGPSGLVVTSPLEIRGPADGVTIGRAIGAPLMRLFRVAASGTLTVVSLNLTDGFALGGPGGEGLGGAVYVGGGALELVGSTLYENTAQGGDGSRVGRGGGVYNDGGQVVVSNSTFSANVVLNGLGTEQGFGGAIFSRNGIVDISHTTITDGPTVPGRGVYAIGDGGTATVHLSHSIIAQADNSASDYVGAFDNGGSIVESGSHNLIRIALTDSQEIVDMDVDPLLGGLLDNGGPTLTHAPLEGSPAIDAGNPNAAAGEGGVPLFDQRGATWSRVVDAPGVEGSGIDIGAFEIQLGGQELPGDYNRDRHVNAADYTVWRNSFGASVAKYSGADGDGDGIIDRGDYDVWKSHYGQMLQGRGSQLPAQSGPAPPQPGVELNRADATSSSRPPAPGESSELPKAAHGRLVFGLTSSSAVQGSLNRRECVLGKSRCSEPCFVDQVSAPSRPTPSPVAPIEARGPLQRADAAEDDNDAEWRDRLWSEWPLKWARLLS